MDMQTPIRVMVADDHPLIRFALDAALADAPAVSICAHARNPAELIAMLDSEPCDVLVTDLLMPGNHGPDGIGMLAEVRRRHPALPIVVLTVVDNPQWLARAMELGVRGFVSKQDDVICVEPAIAAARAGEIYLSERVGQAMGRPAGAPSSGRLSPRESEVLSRYLAGQTVTSIAAQLHRSVKTVSTQKQAAMRKLNLANDADLFMYGMSQGLLQQSAPETD